jgi:hypothetical protein
MPDLATLAQLKTHLNITRNTDDAELGLMLEAAEDVVRSMIGAAGSVEETVTPVAGTVLLSGRPVSDFLFTSVNLSGYSLDSAAGLVLDVAYEGPLDVSYTVGSESVPVAVTLATLIIAAHLWETQRGTSPSALALQGVEDPSATLGVGYAIPNRALQLLQPYLRSAAQIA